VNWEKDTGKIASKWVTHPNLYAFLVIGKTKHIVVFDGAVLA
jgi:hypothetical protein